MPQNEDVPKQYWHEHYSQLGARPIGEGNYAQVYAVQKASEGAELALKTIHTRHLLDPECIRRFETEVTTLSSLSHPNIVQIKDWKLKDPEVWYVMPRFPHTLREILTDLPGDEHRLSHIFSQILDGVAYVHAEGMIHRDLKPSNILLTADDKVAIADFGLVRNINDGTRETRTGVTLGTERYRAPELAGDARGADHRVDIYSLGFILFDMLVGDCTAPLSLEAIPPKYQQIVKKCMESFPEARYQTLRALRSAWEMRDEGDLGKLIGSATKTQEINDLSTILHRVNPGGKELLVLMLQANLQTLEALYNNNHDQVEGLITRLAGFAAITEFLPRSDVEALASFCRTGFYELSSVKIRAKLLCTIIRLSVQYEKYELMTDIHFLLRNFNEEQSLAVLKSELGLLPSGTRKDMLKLINFSELPSGVSQLLPP